MPIPAALAAIGGSLFKNVIQSIFNRADYSYTHRMTAAPQQVAELRQAGLNPALAYGQLGQSQGQSLGNYDSENIGDLVQKDPLIRSQIETSNAQEDYYRALAEKTRNESSEIAFRVLHQDDLYNMDFQYKGLLNRKLGADIYGQVLHNSWQEIENKIRDIDFNKHDRLLESEIGRNVAQSGLYLALKQTEDKLRDPKFQEIQSNLLTLMSLRRLYQSDISLNNKRAITENYNGYLQKTAALYMKWLTDDNKSFAKIDARNKFGLYAPTIMQGINTAVNAGVAIGTRGKFGLPSSSSFGGFGVPTFSLP